MIDPGMWLDGIKAGWAEQLASRGNTGVKGVKPTWDSFWSQQRANMVNTAKQLPTDAFSRKFKNWGIAEAEFGVTDADIRRWQGVLREERAGDAASLDNPLTARLRALGQTGKDSFLDELHNIYGIDFGSSITKDAPEFTGVGRSLAGVGIGLINGARHVNPVEIATGAVRGYTQPFFNGMIRFMNGIQHDADRFALAEKALDRDLPGLADGFLTDLANKGLDVAPLQGKGGYFSPIEVESLAGASAAQDWQKATETLIRAQGDRIAFLGGDFRDKTAKGYQGAVSAGDKALGHVERGVGRYVPFSRWYIRNAPVLAEIAARNPVMAAVLTRQIVSGSQQAQDEGLKPYQANTVPVSTETPVLGALARAYLGGQAGTVRADVLGAAIPFGAELGGEADNGREQTAYQKATGLLGRVGFSPAPPIQALAYVLGQTNQAPGALSRTAPLEKAASLYPGMPELPSGSGVLDMARSVIEPALSKAQILTAGKTGEYDRIGRRYAELVQTTTGKTLDNPANRPYLVAFGDDHDPLWAQAKREILLGGAVRNVAGLVSPVNTTAQGEDARTVQVAKQGTYGAAQIGGSSTAVAAVMKGQNDRYTQATPEVNTYKVASVGDREALLMATWDKDHAKLKSVAPEIFKQRRADYLSTVRGKK